MIPVQQVLDRAGELHRAGNLQQAEQLYRQILQAEPDHVPALYLIGLVNYQCGSNELAWEFITRALELQPDFAEAHFHLGNVLRAQEKLPEAARCFEQALRLKPDFVEALLSVGFLHEEQGKLAEAETAYRQILRLQPSLAVVHARLAGLLRGKLPEADLGALRQQLADGRLGVEARAQLWRALAQVLDDRGEFDQAADCLTQATAARRELAVLQNRRYEPEKERSFFDALLREFGPDFLARVAGGGLDTDRPVFVFGLPRSGTTLVEQILASHSRVHGAGEIPLGRQSFDAIPAVLGRSEDPLSCVRLLDAGAIRRLAERHLGSLTALVPPDVPADRIVDKTPANYLYLGLIAALFPRAVLIHCRRDLRDVGVSCLMTEFFGTHWANDPQHIASHFRQYRRLMDHWHAVLPIPIHEIQYEELVKDLEGMSRRLISASHLEWEPACLEFYRTRRQIRTPSMFQVRQPIYTKSVGRWKNYETVLAELFAALP